MFIDDDVVIYYLVVCYLVVNCYLLVINDVDIIHYLVVTVAVAVVVVI